MYRFCGLGSFTDDLAAAIQKFEGTCPSPLACRNNNPGNLRAGPGAIGVDSRGIAVFPDYATGEAALLHQVDLNIGRGLTLQEFFTGGNGYPGYDKTAPNYAPTVAGWLGIDPNTPLQSISGSPDGFSPSPSDSFDPSGGTQAGISDGAMLALGIAGIGLLVWAAS
jgi:hypothetical protein